MAEIFTKQTCRMNLTSVSFLSKVSTKPTCRVPPTFCFVFGACHRSISTPWDCDRTLPYDQAAAQATTLEYGNTASLRAVVASCSTLTNARLVHLMLGRYRLKAHLRVLKKFLLHGQVKLEAAGDVLRFRSRDLL